MKFEKTNYRLTDANLVAYFSLGIGMVCLAVTYMGYKSDSGQFYHSYLVAFMFWLSIALGGMFFVLLHHLVSATWSVIIRRIVECVMMNFPLLIVCFIPIYFGLHDLFHWTHADEVAKDALLQQKSSYLNSDFFLLRAIIFLSIWTILTTLLYKISLKQDKKHQRVLIDRLKYISGPGMVLYALSQTFAAFDWMMSLSPHWYSTIFGVYFFAGSFLAILSFITLIIIFLRYNNILRDEISIEHLHNLGKLLFAFTIFWTYIAFSQYFLIWYGNIPEETEWYLHRWNGNWKPLSLFIVFGHFVFPFLFLLSRVPKRSIICMTFICIWMLVMHWIDLYWIIMPNYHHHFHFTWMDPLMVIGLGGIFIFVFWKRLIAHSIVPINDPDIKASIHYT